MCLLRYKDKKHRRYWDWDSASPIISYVVHVVLLSSKHDTSAPEA